MFIYINLTCLGYLHEAPTSILGGTTLCLDDSRTPGRHGPGQGPAVLQRHLPLLSWLAGDLQSPCSQGLQSAVICLHGLGQPAMHGGGQFLSLSLTHTNTNTLTHTHTNTHTCTHTHTQSYLNIEVIFCLNFSKSAIKNSILMLETK